MLKGCVITMNKKIEYRPFYESSLYIGSFDNKTNLCFTEQDLSDCISKFQDSYDTMIPVRISSTTYLSGTDYKEHGWKVSVIDYPPVNADIDTINDFMIAMGKTLHEKFNQHKISVVTPSSTLTIEERD